MARTHIAITKVQNLRYFTPGKKVLSLAVLALGPLALLRLLLQEARSPDFAHVAYGPVEPTQEAEALSDSTSLWNGNWTLDLLLALLMPWVHLFQDWIKGMGLYKWRDIISCQ